MDRQASSVAKPILAFLVAVSLGSAALTVQPASASGVYLFRESTGRVVLSDVPGVSQAKLLIGEPKTEDQMQGFISDHERVALYIGLIRKFCRLYNLPEHLVKAIMQVESSFKPEAVSHKGAVGLMQVMPATARDIGIQGDLSNPEVNIEAGCRYLAMMMNRYKGNISLALAAYNAGPNAVDAAGGVIPDYPETKAYVNNVLDIANRFKTGSVYIVEIAPGRYLLTNY